MTESPSDTPEIGRDGRPLSGMAPSCDHATCEEGGPLNSSCSPCAATVCAADPYCCSVQWDSICVNEAESMCEGGCEGGVCEHDICEEGAALDANCDTCAASICAVDPYCCNNSWDSICVAEVATVCGGSCEEPAPECEHDKCETGKALNAACDPCVADICAADPFCCSSGWDRICVREVTTICELSCEEEPPPMAEVDILFVIDGSCSMADEQQKLAAEGNTLLAYVQQQNLDFQIGVTSMDPADNGNLNGGVIDNNTADPMTAFEAAVNVGTFGAPTEAGLETSYLALTSNPGFVRQGADLVVIYLSDENDQSPQTVTFYETFLTNLKGPQQGTVTVNAIIGLGQGSASCFSDPGVRYEQVVNTTNGTAVEICNNTWSPALTGF